MPREQRIDLVHRAIQAGRIGWKDASLRRFRADVDMKSFSERGVAAILRDFAIRGGKLQARAEDPNTDWYDDRDPWWYFAVVPVAEFSRGLFVKVKLVWEEGDEDEDAFVQVVSVHEQKEGPVL